MEALNVIENYANSDENTNQDFLQSVDSKMNVKINYEKKDMDFSWVDIFDETLLYIDNILRNPKKFIINEEEIVKVEQAKKITVETIVHLTQHTNLIQDYNPETADVRPAKVLNINKEESLDTYENRFIYTLIRQMNDFMEMHLPDLDSLSYCYDEKSIKYDATAKLDSENVKISLALDSSDKQVRKEEAVDGVSNSERVKKIKVQLDGFMNSELMRTLSKLHVPIVRPPIRKTNVILKNPNFQKALLLWDFLQSYEKNNFTFDKDHQDYVETGHLRDQFDESFLINYLALNLLSKKTSKVKEEKFVSFTVSKIIESILDSNEDITKDEFYKIVNKEYINAKNKIDYRDTIINNIFNDKFDKLHREISEISSILEV